MSNRRSYPAPKTKINTTLPAQPFPINAVRRGITTPRLVLRPLREDDLQALFEIRSQPEVMRTQPPGRPDTDILRDTKPVLDKYLAPKDRETFYFAICLKVVAAAASEQGDTELEGDKMIGVGGCHRLASPFGWPVVGYMIRREYWGLGLMTEFLTGYLELWKGLERREVVIEVDERTVTATIGNSTGEGLKADKREEDLGHGTALLPVVPEQIVTWAVVDNFGSWRVMEKAGFEHLLTWKEADLRDPSVEVELKAYRYFV
ncbi:putative GMP synthase [Naviculisporaceae sp. PSN 640]